jgi:hypothetical protein
MLQQREAKIRIQVLTWQGKIAQTLYYCRIRQTRQERIVVLLNRVGSHLVLQRTQSKLSISIPVAGFWVTEFPTVAKVLQSGQVDS